MLNISNLHVTIEAAGKPILQGLNLHLAPGEVHVLMGPNGAGKSTLGYTLAGREGYEVTAGTLTYHLPPTTYHLLEMSPDERARAGLFLAFQYPVELPGVNAAQFLRTAINAHRTARGEEEMNALEFLKATRAEMKNLGMSEDFLTRSVNTGFSGGEKKRFEMLQLALLQPSLAILDETDSGLDIDALKTVAESVNRLRSPTRSFLIITHYQRLLETIRPDVVHIMSAGKIVTSGGPELALKLEKTGYEGLLNHA